MVSVVFQVIEGEFAGWKIFENFNLWNSNDIALRIARKQFATLTRAVEKPNIENACEIIDKVVMVEIDLHKRKDTGEMENRCVNYSSVATGATPDQSAPQTPAPDESKPSFLR